MWTDGSGNAHYGVQPKLAYQEQKHHIMFTEPVTLTHLIISIASIGGGVIIGIIVQRIILARLKKFAAKTRWEGDEIIIASIRGSSVLCFGIAGVYAALMALPLQPAVNGLFVKIMLVVIIFVITIIIARLAVGFINLQNKKAAGALPSTSLFVNLTRIIIFVIGLLVILQTLGISITPIITALGVGGLAVALALQPTLSNLFAGLQIIISKQVEPGDYVELDSGEKGVVTDISWRNTTIRDLPNNLIVIPNSKLANTIVRNFNKPQREMAVLIDVGVSYDSDLEKVERVTIEVAKQVVKEVQGGKSDYEPFIRYKEFDDFSINFTVILRVHEYINKFLVRHEFIKKLHKRYKQEGIEIPFPIRTVHMKHE